MRTHVPAVTAVLDNALFSGIGLIDPPFTTAWRSKTRTPIIRLSEPKVTARHAAITANSFFLKIKKTENAVNSTKRIVRV